MERGDGRAARRVLVEEFGAEMMTVAKDVKLQAEFNQDLVKRYRLLGYENRAIAAQDFRDDKKDGGEMGAGETGRQRVEEALRKFRGLAVGGDGNETVREHHRSSAADARMMTDLANLLQRRSGGAKRGSGI